MINEVIRFTIDIPPTTKKNHSQIIKVKGRPILIPSKQYKEFENACFDYMPNIETINYPINLCCIYYMPTRRRVDLTNLLAATCDILVKYKVIEDDNSQIVYSHDNSRVFYSKESPRTEVIITRVNVNEWKS